METKTNLIAKLTNNINNNQEGNKKNVLDLGLDKNIVFKHKEIKKCRPFLITKNAKKIFLEFHKQEKIPMNDIIKQLLDSRKKDN